MTLEERALAAPPEFRAEDGAQTVVGYAAVFNEEALIAGQFREKILPGAFSKTMGGDVKAYWNHDSGAILGRTKAGTLRLKEDERGLAVEIDLPETTIGRDLRVSLQRGDVEGMSFGFRVPEGGDDWDFRSNPPLRSIREVELFEVSAVPSPAYSGTELALRSMEAAKAEARKDQAEYNAKAAEARIAARKAAAEQKFRRI